MCAALQGTAAADTSKLRADLDAALAELKDVKAARSAADKAAKVGRLAGCCLLQLFSHLLGRCTLRAHSLTASMSSTCRVSFDLGLPLTRRGPYAAKTRSSTSATLQAMQEA